MLGPSAGQVRAAALAFLQDPECRHGFREFYSLTYAVPPIFLGANEWLIAGHNDVVTVMKSEGAELTALYPVTRCPAINELFLGMLPFRQGADHRRLRSLTRPLFSPVAIARLQHEISAVLEAALYPAVFEADGCDVLSTLGVLVPEVISCLLLDASPRDWEAIGEWSRKMYKQIGRYDFSENELAEAESAYAAFYKYVRRRMEGEAGAQYGGVGEALLASWRTGDLEEHEVPSYFALFLLTGLDTLTYAIGNALWFLGNFPEVFCALKEAPNEAGAVFDEAMRLWGPVRVCVRHLQRSVQLSTETICEGSIVFLLIHAANRDPRRFARPDEIVLHRPDADGLAFGVGPHGCLGTALGKLVGRTLYQSLGTNCRFVRSTPGIDEPRFTPSLPILGVDSVRLFADPDYSHRRAEGVVHG